MRVCARACEMVRASRGCILVLMECVVPSAPCRGSVVPAQTGVSAQACMRVCIRDEDAGAACVSVGICGHRRTSLLVHAQAGARACMCDRACMRECVA